MSDIDDFLKRTVSKNEMIKLIQEMPDTDGAVLMIKREGGESYTFRCTTEITSAEAYHMSGCYMRILDEVRKAN